MDEVRVLDPDGLITIVDAKVTKQYEKSTSITGKRNRPKRAAHYEETNGYRKLLRKELTVDIKPKRLVDEIGDGRLVDGNAVVLPSGKPDGATKRWFRWLNESKRSPYNKSTKPQILVEKERRVMEKRNRAFSTEKRAQRKMHHIVQEMLRSEGTASAAELETHRLPETLRTRFVETYDAPLEELIQEWSQDTKRILEEQSGPVVEEDPALLNTKIPTLDDVIIDQGNGPKFYGIQRHPFPGRLPSRFASPKNEPSPTARKAKRKFSSSKADHIVVEENSTTEEDVGVGREEEKEERRTFIKRPPTEWRTMPKEAVLQKAYSYMLNNIAISDEKSLNIAVSKEMNTNLKTVFDKNVGHGFWKDEVSSKVAQPLSASAFCASRPTQLFTSASAPGLDPEHLLPPLIEGEPRTKQYQRLDCRQDIRGPTKLGKPISDEGDKPKMVATIPSETKRIKREEEWEFQFSDEAHQAATLISRTYLRRYNHRANACKKIQTRVRGMLTRKYVAAVRAIKVEAAVKIQAAARGRLTRHCFMFFQMAKSHGISIQDLACWDIAKLPANVKIALAKERAENARKRWDRRIGNLLTNIQAKHRGNLGRKRAAMERELRKWKIKVAIHLQRLHRGNKARAEIASIKQTLKLGLSRVQARWRGNRDRRNYHILVTKRQRAALLAQKVFRGHQGRKRFAEQKRIKEAATTINSAARRKLAYKIVARWKISRCQIEADRLATEIRYLDKLIEKSVLETKAFLRTKEGKAELKIEIKKAHEDRVKLKVARGKMSPSELAQSLAEEAFELFDLDGSEEIDHQEFKKAVAELCLPLSKTQIADALHAMDTDGNGVITKDEFVEWYLSLTGMTPSQTHGLNKTLQTAIQLKLKSSKAIRDISGSTDRNRARRRVFARCIQRDRLEAQRKYRETHPPDLWYLAYVFPTKKKHFKHGPKKFA